MVGFFDKYQTNKNCLFAIKWSWALICSKSGCGKQACRSNHAQNGVVEMTAKVRSIFCPKGCSVLAVNRFRALLFIQKALMPMFGSKLLLKYSGKNGAKKKIAGATALNTRKTVKQIYFNNTSDYSSNQVVYACVVTNKQTHYKFFKKVNGVLKIRKNTLGFFQLAAIRRVKAWLCNVYSWMCKKHIEKNPNEFSFKKNRSVFSATIFHKLIENAV